MFEKWRRTVKLWICDDDPREEYPNGRNKWLKNYQYVQKDVSFRNP